MKRLVAFAVVGLALGAHVARAEIASDRAAALLIYPSLLVSDVASIDTYVQISNTTGDPVAARCFYVNTVGYCSNSGAACTVSNQCGVGQCIPAWNETDFYIQLTPQQPMAWRVSDGLAQAPIDGIFRQGSDGSNNGGTRVPPMHAPFLGELKCVVVDDQMHPTDNNALVGSLTNVQVLGSGSFLDVTRLDAVGIQAIPGANDGDNRLVIGEEYTACPQTLVMDQFFDFATDPVSGQEVRGAVVLAPCAEDFVKQDQNLTRITVQFLVFNEFEQRLSTSTPIDCFGVLPLSSIDTTRADRSIFSVFVSGTLTGQTRIRGVGTDNRGLVGAYYDIHGVHSSAMNLHYQGDSPGTDILRLP